MKIPPDAARAAVILSLTAALLWATYYIFVLAITPAAPPSAVLVYPFLFGGALYAVWCALQGHGRAFARLFLAPAAYGRVALLLGMQLSVLASTYIAGAVDTSLLSLIGDVVLTPVVVGVWIAAYRTRIGAPLLWMGMILCTVGGGLAIAGGHGLSALHGWGYVVLGTIPVTVALYFLSTARENERTPASAVVSHSMLVAGVVGIAITPWVPGGLGGLAVATPLALLGLVATGVTSFFLAPVLYFDSIRRAGFVLPPMMMTGIPVFAALLSWGVLGIAIPWLGILGIPVAVVGALIALRGETAPEDPGRDAALP